MATGNSTKIPRLTGACPHSAAHTSGVDWLVCVKMENTSPLEAADTVAKKWAMERLLRVHVRIIWGHFFSDEKI